jgi:hypothetical protein
MTPPLTLAERMAEALDSSWHDFATVQTIECRRSVYWLHGIAGPMTDEQRATYEKADNEAYSEYLARRLGGANDPE